MSNQEEWLDLVNNKDEVIGTIERGEIQELKKNDRGFVRAVDMYIQNDDGMLWVPKRTADKTIAPNGLDYSMGGHIDTGETYEQALMREAEEELNIKLEPAKLEFIKKFSPASTPYFRCFYIYHSNQTPQFNPDDFVSAQWLTPQELLTQIDAGVEAKSSIRETIEELF